MILYYDFGMEPEEYSQLEIANIDFNVPEFCQKCKVRKRLYRHGYRSRYALSSGNEYVLTIIRLICRFCRTTFTVLPTFLVPYFQTVVSEITELIRSRAKALSLHRQSLRNFYIKRFAKNFNIILGFTRQKGIRLEPSVINCIKNKAIKIVQWLCANSPESFHHEFFRRYGKSFMAG